MGGARHNACRADYFHLAHGRLQHEAGQAHFSPPLPFRAARRNYFALRRDDGSRSISRRRCFSAEESSRLAFHDGGLPTPAFRRAAGADSYSAAITMRHAPVTVRHRSSPDTAASLDMRMTSRRTAHDRCRHTARQRHICRTRRGFDSATPLDATRISTICVFASWSLDDALYAAGTAPSRLSAPVTSQLISACRDASAAFRRREKLWRVIGNIYRYCRESAQRASGEFSSFRVDATRAWRRLSPLFH